MPQPHIILGHQDPGSVEGVPPSSQETRARSTCRFTQRHRISVMPSAVQICLLPSGGAVACAFTNPPEVLTAAADVYECTIHADSSFMWG